MRDERTFEVQRGEGGVDAEGGGQLLDALVADTIHCVCSEAGRGRTAHARRACTRDPTGRVADRGAA